MKIPELRKWIKENSKMIGKLTMIPYGRHEITEEDIEAVIKVLKSDFLTQGPQVPKFEKEIADYCGTEHAIAVNSATSAAFSLSCIRLN